MYIYKERERERERDLVWWTIEICMNYDQLALKTSFESEFRSRKSFKYPNIDIYMIDHKLIIDKEWDYVKKLIFIE